MKFSVGHRLFISVLLAILAVAASAIYLLRQNVPGKDETMTGVCEREGGKTAFQLREQRLHD